MKMYHIGIPVDRDNKHTDSLIHALVMLGYEVWYDFDDGNVCFSAGSIDIYSIDEDHANYTRLT